MRNSISRLFSKLAVGSNPFGRRLTSAEERLKLSSGPRLSAFALTIASACFLPTLEALQLTVAWDNSSAGATGFQIERSADGTTFAQITSVAATATNYTDTNLTAGSYWYRVRAYNDTSVSSYSNVASYTTDSAPVFTTQPSSKSAAVGSSVIFSVAVTGSPAPTIVWKKDGTTLSGATGTTLSLPSVTTSDAGTYTAVATNSVQSVVSSGATLTITGTVPSITTQPSSQAVTSGSNVSFTIAASGTPAPSYQWQKNGTAISGATTTTLSLASVSSTDAATYSVVVTNTAGSVTSASASLTVTTPIITTITNNPPSAVPGHLASLSARAAPGQGNQAMTLNFTVNSATKSVLLRGVGPGLAALTTDPTFTDPKLTLYDGGVSVATNDNWGGSSTLSAIFTRVGAFPLPVSSKDAALVSTLAPKSYSTTISGKSSGLAMSEIYDADPAGTLNGRLSKITAQAPVGTGNNVLIAGFTITGETSLRVLIRAIGPGLSGKASLADPQLAIYNGTTLVVRNDNWGGGSALSSTFALAGASSLPAQSKDAAVDVTLAPGSYTAVVSGVNSTTGVAAVEFYELP